MKASGIAPRRPTSQAALPCASISARSLASVTHAIILTHHEQRALASSAPPSVMVRSALPGRYRPWVAALHRHGELKGGLARALAGPGGRAAGADVLAGTLLVRAREHEPEAPAREVEPIVGRRAAAHATRARGSGVTGATPCARCASAARSPCCSGS